MRLGNLLQNRPDALSGHRLGRDLGFNLGKGTGGSFLVVAIVIPILVPVGSAGANATKKERMYLNVNLSMNDFTK